MFLRALVFLLIVAVPVTPSRAEQADHPGLIWVVQPTQLSAYSIEHGAVLHQLDLGNIRWIVTDPANGNAWAAIDDRVIVVGPDGTMFPDHVSLPHPQAGASGVVVDGGRREAWVASGSDLYRYSADSLAPLGSVDAGGTVQALVLDEVEGTLYMIVDGALHRLEREGQPEVLSLPDIGQLSHLSFDRVARRLWVAARTHMLALDSEALVVTGPFPHALKQPQHLAADLHGGAWIADNHELAHFDANGQLSSRSRPFFDDGNPSNSRIRTLLAYPDGPVAWVHHNRLVRSIFVNGEPGAAFEVPGSPAALQTAALHFDIIPPEIVIVRPEEALFTNDNTPAIETVYTDYGSAPDPETLAFQLGDAPLDVACDARPFDAECESIDVLEDGHHVLAATVDDLAGNRAVSTPVGFTVDTVPPELVALSPPDGHVTNQFQLQMEGRFNELVRLNINDIIVIEEFAEEFVHDVVLEEGENIFEFEATDRAGNQSLLSASYLLDSIPPVITVTSPQQDLITREDEVEVTGSVSEAAAVRLNDEPIALGDTLSFAESRPLQEGLNSFTVEARDTAGNTAYESRRVVRDTRPPQPPSGVTVIRTPDGLEIIGSPGALDPFTEIEVILEGRRRDWRGSLSIVDWLLASFQFVRGRADENGAFHLRIDGIFDTDRLRIRYIDPAGNVSERVPLPPAQEDRRNLPVGRVAGEFSVDPTGAANYRIPIDVPRGAAGVQPELALLYSSRAGNGHLGVGWSLSGLSAITRCAKTIAQDGVNDGVDFEQDDVFCLDGQRLIRKGGEYVGEEYRTEIESFQKVLAQDILFNQPGNFEVRDRAGLIREYGRTADSKIQVQGRSHLTWMWLLSKIRDRHGNYIAYHYQESSGDDGNGEHYPTEIAWYNNQDVLIGRVQLEYESRTDTSSGFLSGGGRHALTKRLKQLKVYAGAQLARSYDLRYEQAPLSGLSVLTAVSLCDAEELCLPETRFAWKHPNDLEGSRAELSGGDEYQLADLDADGLPDFVYLAQGQFAVRFGRDPGEIHYTGISYTPHDCVNDNPFPGDEYGVRCRKQFKLRIRQALIADIDGDGFQDLLVPQLHNRHYWWLRSDGNTLQVADDEALEHGIDDEDDLARINNAALDMDGDGLSEILLKRSGTLRIHRYQNGTFGQVKDTGIRMQAKQRILPIHANGDGRSDIFISAGDCTSNTGSHCASPGVWLNDGDDFRRALAQPVSVYIKDPVVIDANGDGLTDVLKKQGDNWHLEINEGDRWQEQEWSGADWGYMQLRALDWNRDGRQDLMVADSDEWSVRISRGNGFGPKTATGYTRGANGNNRDSAQFLDMTGDGVEDLFYHGTEHAYVFSKPTGFAQSLLIAAVDGYGMETVVGYRPLSLMGDAYLGHSDDGLDPEDRNRQNIRDFLAPLPVVEFFGQDTGRARANGNHVKVITWYRYGGAKLDIHGRGFLGFAEVRAINSNTNAVTANFHRQSFPFTGAVSKSELQLPAGSDLVDLDVETLRAHFFPDAKGCVDAAALKTDECSLPDFRPPTYAVSSASVRVANRTTTQLEKRRLGSSWQVFASETDERSYDIGNGNIYRRVVSSFDYDEHGNATVVDVVTDNGAGGDRHRVRTVNTYADSATGWILGRLATSTVTHSAPGTADIVRNAAFTYTPQGLLETETIEPGDPELELTTTYTFDSFGNRRTATTSSSASGMHAIAPRTTQTIHDARGVHVEKIVNAAGHEETSSWDARFNAKTTSTGPNGLTTRWEYDSFGRVVKEYAPRAALVKTVERAWCGGAVGCHARSAEIRVTTRDTTGRESHVELDVLGRELYAYSKQFDNIYTATETWYDMLGRVYLASNPYRFDDPLVCYTFRKHDALGRVVEEHQPRGPQECDKRSDLVIDRLYDYQQPPSSYSLVTKMTYSGLNARTEYPPALPEGPARHVERRENSAGRLVEVKEWDDDDSLITTTYAYNATGETTRVTPPSGKSIQLQYDRRGRKTGMQDPDMGQWSYVHNPLGELVQQTDAKGQTVHLHHDLLGRLVRRVEPEGESTWSYDTAPGKSIGKPARVTGPDGFVETYSYTAHGELETTSRLIDGLVYQTTHSYDSFGRLHEIAYPLIDADDGLRVRHHYSNGTLVRVSRAAGNDGDDFWQLGAMDAFGHATSAQLGNGLAESATYDLATGRVIELGVGPGENSNFTHQYLQYWWDAAGNLIERRDRFTDTTETFAYDRLHRLSRTTFIAGQYNVTRHFEYDAAGNITRKGSLTGYRYGEGSNGDVRPHAVTQLSKGGATWQYAYDANGNATHAAGREITWSSDNKPVRIEKNGAYSTFAYSPDRQRYRHHKQYANGDTETTHYAGLVERLERRKNGITTVEHRQHVFAGGKAVAVVTRFATSGIEQTRYLHRDHLGSVVLITDDAGRTIEEQAFDAFGAATIKGSLNPSPWRVAAVVHITTHRGYTGHEMLDHLGLIHMNGRVYDPEIGRFLSADPFVQYPASTQGYNRYSYLNNNPLNAIDPSGYFSWSQFKKDTSDVLSQIQKPVKQFVRNVFATMSPQFAALVITVASYYCGPAAPACAGSLTYEYQRSQGAPSDSALRSAAAAAVSAYAVQTAGRYADGGQYLKAYASAYAGGYSAARINGADGVKGGTTAALLLTLKVAMDKYSGHPSTMDTATEGAAVKSSEEGVRNGLRSNTGAEIVIDPNDASADRFINRPLASLSQEEMKYLAQYNKGKILLQPDGRYVFAGHTEGGTFMNGLSRNMAGVNGFSVFHDQWMFNWGNIQNGFVLAVTIPPAAYLQYCALGGCQQYQVLRGR